MEGKKKKTLSPYFLLEVEREATPAQIKSAYKKLALVSKNFDKFFLTK